MQAFEKVQNAISGEDLIPRITVAGFTLLTILAQHPHPSFNRARGDWDVFTIIPNWKFFAPYPATKDYHYAYRILDTSGKTHGWHEIALLEERKLRHAIWFAKRRTGKAVFDLCSSLMARLAIPNCGSPRRFPEYKLLTAFIQRQIKADYPATQIEKFQFAIVESSGYDSSEDPNPVFISGAEYFHLSSDVSS